MHSTLNNFPLASNFVSIHYAVIEHLHPWFIVIFERMLNYYVILRYFNDFSALYGSAWQDGSESRS